MTYDHNYTTHQEHWSSERFTRVIIPWWRKEVRTLVMHTQVGAQVLKAWEKWSVTVPSFLLESHIVRYLLLKACVGECFTQFQKGKKKGS